MSTQPGHPGETGKLEFLEMQCVSLGCANSVDPQVTPVFCPSCYLAKMSLWDKQPLTVEQIIEDCIAGQPVEPSLIEYSAILLKFARIVLNAPYAIQLQIAEKMRPPGIPTSGQVSADHMRELCANLIKVSKVSEELASIMDGNDLGDQDNDEEEEDATLADEITSEFSTRLKPLETKLESEITQQFGLPADMQGAKLHVRFMMNAEDLSEPHAIEGLAHFSDFSVIRVGITVTLHGEYVGGFALWIVQDHATYFPEILADTHDQWLSRILEFNSDNEWNEAANEAWAGFSLVDFVYAHIPAIDVAPIFQSDELYDLFIEISHILACSLQLNTAPHGLIIASCMLDADGRSQVHKGMTAEWLRKNAIRRGFTPAEPVNHGYNCADWLGDNPCREHGDAFLAPAVDHPDA